MLGEPHTKCVGRDIQYRKQGGCAGDSGRKYVVMYMSIAQNWVSDVEIKVDQLFYGIIQLVLTVKIIILYNLL